MHLSGLSESQYYAFKELVMLKLQLYLQYTMHLLSTGARFLTHGPLPWRYVARVNYQLTLDIISYSNHTGNHK